MSLFPELEDMPLHRLQEHFAADTFYNGDLAERELWLQEIAVRIAKSGAEGLSFLIRSIHNADHARLRAILLSFSFVPPPVARERRGELTDLLLAFLASEDPMLVAEAIEALNCLDVADLEQNIVPFLTHQSPYVVGSALRYFSRHYPQRAKPLLLEALRSKEPIVRQNAIDELDRLGCSEAVPYLRPLVYDEDKHVRQAAQTALADLEQGGPDR
jgi:hypothetical protein